MAKKRLSFPSSFNLSFLDIMSCGLGAVILILMLVKFEEKIDHTASQKEQLQQELIALQNALQQTKNEEIRIQTKHADTQKNYETHQKEYTQLQKDVTILQNLLKQKQEKFHAISRTLEQTIAQKQKKAVEKEKTQEDIVTLKKKNEQEFILGLRVEGANIGILLDASASMTDDTLTDIILRKVSDDENKKKGPKWQRAKNTTRWLLNHMPHDSVFSILLYNDRAHMAGMQKTYKIHEKKAVDALLHDIENFIPSRATNLDIALQQIQKNHPSLTDLYIITDGLPTKGQSGILRCKEQDTVSGECRLYFLQKSIDTFPRHIKVNVILLPLEGDPFAAHAYWLWTAQTGGLFLSPSTDWP